MPVLGHRAMFIGDLFASQMGWGISRTGGLLYSSRRINAEKTACLEIKRCIAVAKTANDIWQLPIAPVKT